MLFDASRSTLLFTPLFLLVILSILLIPSHSLNHKIHRIYRRQLSLATRFTVTTLTKTVTISPQSELLPLSSSTSPLSASFRPPPHSSFAFSTSSSSLSPVKSLSSTSPHRGSTSLSSQTLLVTPQKTTLFFPLPVPISTPRTPVSLPVYDDKATSTPPVIASSVSSNQDVPLPSVSAPLAGATSSGFWNNKGAVGGTFAAVGLVVIGIGAMFLIPCLKKRLNRKAEEELSSGSLDKNDMSDWPAQTNVSGFIRQQMDPFAAGDVVRIRGNSMPITAASASRRYGHAILEDNQTSCEDYTSSNPGRIDYPYSATYSDSRASLNRPKVTSPHRPPWSPASSSSRPTGLLDVPPTHESAVPVSPGSVASVFTLPSSRLDVRQIERRDHLGSGASFYASQTQLHYYDENVETLFQRGHSTGHF